MKSTPNAIPRAHTLAIAESSRTPSVSLILPIEKAASTAAPAAESKGLIPRYSPNPIPPKEAWVIPPLMKTILRTTIYEPTTPHTTAVSSEAMRAF